MDIRRCISLYYRAEALYSDLGHCGRGNIRVSWIFVKSALIINYLGQGAWLLSNHSGKIFTKEVIDKGFNPFYGIMPDSFKIIGIVIATVAAIIASQALISGSFTLISESMRLNLWPKMKINYPTEERGQLFIPGINTIFFLGCIGITFYFRTSSNMEAAYGLGNHALYVGHFSFVCQFSCFTTELQNFYLFIPYRLSSIETEFLICQS